jgi:hypothetical protein
MGGGFVELVQPATIHDAEHWRALHYYLEAAQNSHKTLMKTALLSDLLTQEQMEEVVAIFNDAGNDMDAVRQLKIYLNNIKEQLEAKGIVPDYLAYVLLASFRKLI